jgi:hypothetical protein
MRVTKGRVVGGRIEVEGEALPEGKTLKIVILEDEAFSVTDEEKRFLLESLASAERGETVDGFELLEELRRAN